jgi:hypothetical protein
LLRSCTVGLRALGLNSSVHLLHNSPFRQSLSSLRALAKSLPGSGSELHPLWSAASARLKSPRGFEAARSAPDWRPIPSLRSVIPQAASRARFALDSAPHQSRLGTLLPLSLAGARSCFCRDQISQRWGASFTLLRLGASHHGSPALGGLRKLSLWEAKSFWRYLQSGSDFVAPVIPATCSRAGEEADGLRALAHSNLKPSSNHKSIAIQSSSMHDQTRNMELIKAYATH